AQFCHRLTRRPQNYFRHAAHRFELDAPRHGRAVRHQRAALPPPVAPRRTTDGKALFPRNGRADEVARSHGSAPRPYRPGQRHRHRSENRRTLRRRRPSRRRFRNRLLAAHTLCGTVTPACPEGRRDCALGFAIVGPALAFTPTRSGSRAATPATPQFLPPILLSLWSAAACRRFCGFIRRHPSNGPTRTASLLSFSLVFLPCLSLWPSFRAKSAKRAVCAPYASSWRGTVFHRTPFVR